MNYELIVNCKLIMDYELILNYELIMNVNPHSYRRRADLLYLQSSRNIFKQHMNDKFSMH